MPSLQVREVPEILYRKLVKKAKAEHRSIAQETINLLSKSLDVDLSPKEKRMKVIKRIDARHKKYDFSNLPDPIEMIREDRNR